MEALDTLIDRAGPIDQADSPSQPQTQAPSDPLAQMLTRAGVDVQALDKQNQQAQQLRQARETDAQAGDDTLQHVARRVGGVIPFGSTVLGIRDRMQYENALHRYHEGKAEGSDYSVIAEYERHNREQAQRESTTAGHIWETASRLPSMALEFMAGGSVASRLGAGSAPSLLSGAAYQSAGAFGRAFGGLAVTTAAMPSMYAEQAVARNYDAGRGPADPRGLAPAFAMGMINTAILGRLGSLAEGRGLAARTLIRTGTGIGEQAIADVLGSAIGLSTGYGTVGQLLRGDDDLTKHLLGQALTFAAFSFMHGDHEASKEVTKSLTDLTRETAHQGQPRSQAVTRAQEALQPVVEALKRNPDLTRDEAMRSVVDLPEGPARNLAEAAANTLPAETTQQRVETANKPPETASGASEPEKAKPPIETPVRQPEATPRVGSERTPLSRLTDQEVIDLSKSLLALKNAPKTRKDAEQKLRSSAVAGQLGQLEEAVLAARAPKVGDRAERRQDVARRKKVAEMTPDERSKALLTSSVVDLPNRRAFEEADPAKVYGMSDADGLKAFNDRFGYAAGDALLRAKAEALKAAGVEAYHEKGDEFLYRGNDPAELKSKIEKAREILRKSIIDIETKDGLRRLTGADFSYGVGNGIAEAEAGLKAHKAEREARGERARGELRGISDYRPEESNKRESRAPALLESMRRRQERLKATPAPSEPVLREPETLSKPEQEAERHFAQTKYEDIPKELRDRIENVARQLEHDPEAIKQTARSAYAAGGEEGLKELLAMQEQRVKPITPEEASPEKLATAEQEADAAVKEFQDEVARAYRAAQRSAYLKASVQRRIAERIQKSLEDAQTVDPRARDASGDVAAKIKGPAQAASPGEANGPTGAPAPAERSAPSSNILKARRARAIPKRYAAEASEMGIEPDNLHGLAEHIRTVDKQGLEEQNDLYKAIKKAAATLGNTPQAIARVLRKGGDAENLKALDTIHTYLDGPERVIFDTARLESGMEVGEFALDIIRRGPRKLISEDAAYTQAMNHLWEAKKIAAVKPEEISDANGRLQKAGGKPLTQEDIARVEAEGLNESAQRKVAGEVREPHAQEEAAQSEGQGELAGEGNDPGTFNPEEFSGPGFGRTITGAEQAGVLPGGGSGESGPGRQQHITALANEVVDKERVKNGLPPLMQAARLENATVWDQAMAKLDHDPQLGARLVDELAKKSRATTVEENAILLHRKIALRNEHERAILDYLRASKEGADAVTLNGLESRETELGKKIDELDKVTKSTGTDWGRAGQFRKQLAAEDYSLSGMLQKAAAAKGRPLTREEQQQILDMQKRIEVLQSKLDQAESALAASGKGAQSPDYKDMLTSRVEAEEAKAEFKRQINADRDARLPWAQRMENWWLKFRRAEVISSPLTMAKIVAASAQRMTVTPLEEGVGAILSRLPGIGKIAAMAPRQGKGFRVEAEKKAFVEGFGQGMVDAWDSVKKGHSELDTIYGNTDSPRSWLDFVGELHAAGKAPAVRNEYTRSFLQRLDSEAARGHDVSSPAALLRIGTEAYKDSQRAKFQQDNWLVDKIKKLIEIRKGAGFWERAWGITGQTLLPVVRIPTNLVAETFQYAFGTVTGSTRAAVALAKGIESLKPEQADLIMRSLKKGSLGLAALTVGFLNPQMFGGFYSGKRDERDVKAGAARTPIGDVPSWLLHNPFLEVFQVGATARRALVGVKRGESPDAVTAFGAGILGLVEEVPIARETLEVRKAFTPRERGAFFGEMAKSLAVPQLFQWLAGRTDQNTRGETIRRRPQGVLQHIETGIPGLRQTVPQAR